MITNQLASCVVCRHSKENDTNPLDQYDLDALKVVSEVFPYSICEEHKKAMDARILELTKLEPKVYSLKKGEVKTFVPKTVPVKPNYQDREPNDGSLIE